VEALLTLELLGDGTARAPMIPSLHLSEE